MVAQPLQSMIFSEDNSSSADTAVIGVIFAEPIQRTEFMPSTIGPPSPRAGSVIASAVASSLTPAALEAEPPSSLDTARPLHLLLADDSPDNRALIKAYLKRLPYQVDEASNGELALGRFAASAYDVVLMDLQMPVMDGLTAIRAIRSHEASHH